jgi:signal transduction histidine kinase
VGFAEMPQSDTFGKPTRQKIEYAGYIKQAGEHLLGLINDLMDVARMEAGRLNVKDEPVDLGAEAEAALDMARPLGQKAGVAVRLKNEAPGIAVRGDDLRLRQALLNLLSNAVKYSNPPGEAVLRIARAEGGGVTIAVLDRGIGMTAEEIEEALRPFGRADNQEARRRQGTGLGLSIVRHLVELHDGTLEVSSERGKGTTVVIRLPKSRVLDLGGGAKAAQ